MEILYLVFGNRLSDHIQAHFSMRTMLEGLEQDDHIHVITTSPEYYERFSFIDTIPITNEDLSEWEGEYHFFWRVKIKAMQKLAEKYPGRDLLYLDSDTFLKGASAGIHSTLAEGKGMMHLNEGHPKDMMSRSLRMWKQVKGRTCHGITIGERHCMWNAGVVGIPGPKVSETLSLALELCDWMLADGVEKRMIEQYSLSIALLETVGLAAADSWIGHYWGNKEEWNRMESEFFLKSYLMGGGIDGEREAIRDIPLGDTPLRVRIPNTQRRLVALVKRLFPDETTN